MKEDVHKILVRESNRWIEKDHLCNHCKSKIKRQIDCNPTWYGVVRGGMPIETICIDCWGKGIRMKG